MPSAQFSAHKRSSPMVAVSYFVTKPLTDVTIFFCSFLGLHTHSIYV